MKRVLVTGASGLVGRVFLQALPGDVQPVALGRQAPEGVELIRHDLRYPQLPTLPRDIDTVVHLAQEPNFRDFPASATAVYAVNTGATLQLLEWARTAGVARFILASTGGLYSPAHHPINEHEPIEIADGPLAFYFAAKRSAELLVERYRPFLTTAILRFFFVYGRGQPSTMLFPRLIASVREGRPLHLQGTEGLTFNPVHARDAGAAVTSALETAGHLVANIAGPEIISMRSLGEEIGRQLNKKPTFEIAAGQRPASMVADIAMMRARLTVPNIGIAKGVADALRED